MTFDMKNATVSFQRMIPNLTYESYCESYMDDLVVLGDTWSDHLTKKKTELYLTAEFCQSEDQLGKE